MRTDRTPFMGLVLAALAVFALVPTGAAAATKLTEHTVALNGAAPPEATLADVGWLTGSWSGEGLGGVSEEIWSEPRGGAMVATYRLLMDGAVAFYEIMTIVETEGTLLFRLKHFDPDLTGWEEKDETVDFPLVAVEENRILFDGMTYVRTGANEVTVYVAMEGDDGTMNEGVFVHRRVE